MTDTVPTKAAVLLLDSDPLTRAILHETLERAGHVVMGTGDLGAAVDRVRMMTPDLLIVRPYISGMPGQVAAQYLRSTCCPGLRVLIVGGFMDDDRIRVQSAVHDFHVFPKPFAADELLDKVSSVLRHRVPGRAKE